MQKYSNKNINIAATIADNNRNKIRVAYGVCTQQEQIIFYFHTRARSRNKYEANTET